MKKKHLLSTALLAMASSISASVLASDHADSPNASKDPTADITDIFVFASPENRDRLVVALNVNPGAFNNALFSDAVTYSIRLRTDEKAGAAQRELRIDCNFDLTPPSEGGAKKQLATCTGYDFDPATGRLNVPPIGGKPIAVNDSTDGKNGLRIFTGMRADSWHIDAPGSIPALRGEGWKYTTGKNTLAMLDVQSIVVEIDVAKIFGKDVKRFKAAGETTMRVRKS